MKVINKAGTPPPPGTGEDGGVRARVRSIAVSVVACLSLTAMTGLTSACAGSTPASGGTAQGSSVDAGTGRPTTSGPGTVRRAAGGSTSGDSGAVSRTTGTVGASPDPAETTGGTGQSRTTLPPVLVGRDWEVLPSGGAKVVALTFDGGGSDAAVASILGTLHRTGTPGTFFLTGHFVTRYPSAAQQIAAGHRIGNHTATHPALTGLDDAAVRAEVIGGADRIRAVTGVDPRPWFRFPFGDRDARTVRDVNLLGYASVRWTVDSLGWQGTEAGHRTSATVTARVLAGARPGGVVLLHVGANPDDGSTLDADALPGIIAGLRGQGYRLVGLDELRP